MYADDVQPEAANATYFAQTAAFHSRVHKQADDLSFIWYDRHRDILSDPARYAYQGRTEPRSKLARQGFWYSDPKRIYVERTRAHNCVEIDATSYPRLRSRAFGSALAYAGEQNGLLVTDCKATHMRTVRHRRIVILRPGQFLLVLDWLKDRTATRDFRQWFSLAPQWVAERTSGAAVLAQVLDENGSQLEALTVTSLIDEARAGDVAHGRSEPELLGWSSNAAFSLVPSPSFAFETLGSNTGRFAMLFVFGTLVHVNGARTRFNSSMRNGTVIFDASGLVQEVTIEAGQPGEVIVSYACAQSGQ